MTDPGPRARLPFQVVDITGDGFPSAVNEAFEMMMGQAVSGGDGTRSYLRHLLKLADLASFLDREGLDAYVIDETRHRATATDGTATLCIDLVLYDEPVPTSAQDVSYVGMATISLALPKPNDLHKLANLGLVLAEIPAGIVVGKKLWQALFRPLLTKLSKWVQTSVERWLAVEVGAVEELGEVVADVAVDVAAELSEDVTEVVVEEVVLEVAIDLSAAVPAFAALAVLVAVPVLLHVLAKDLIVHFEIDNMTDSDFAWSIPYAREGSLTAKPAATIIPKMGTAVDMWGDTTDAPVVYQACFSAINDGGFQGIGWAMQLVPQGVSEQDIAVVVAIPWAADNAIWLGDPGKSPRWNEIYQHHCASSKQHSVHYGNRHFSVTLAIDDLHGNGDEYHCVLRIQSL